MSPRTKVLWFGSGEGRSLKRYLERLAHLETVRVSSEKSMADEMPTAHAAVFEFSNNTAEYVARVRRMRDLALENGTLVVLVRAPDANNELFQVVAKRLSDGFPQPYGPESAVFRPIREFEQDYCLAAHEISIWQPGPAMNRSLQIKGKYNSEHGNLLRRGFSDFDYVEISQIAGGASGASVYSVTPSEQPRTPFLAKVDETSRIAAEVDNYTKYVSKSVSFNHRPNLDVSRTVYTPKLSLLVEDFLERAEPIYNVLPHSIPAVLVSSIFEGALRNWRRESEARKVNLSTQVLHLEKILKRKEPAFLAAAALGKAKFSSPFGGEELLSACSEIEDSVCTWSRIHGDLHAGNIYVGVGSSDVILIDFYKTEQGPCSLDLACFEVDIAFKRARISRRVALRLYEPPLALPPLDVVVGGSTIWLLDTIRAVRRYALTELDRRAYTFALACYLIRYASFETNGTEQKRAVATCVASRLIKYLRHEKTK